MAFSDEISWFTLHHLLKWNLVNKLIDKQFLQALSGAFSDILRGYLPPKGMSTYYEQKKLVKIEGFEPIILMLGELIEKIKSSKKLSNDEATQIKVKEIIKEAEHLIQRLQTLSEEDDNMLRWSEARDNAQKQPIVRIKSVPLDISGLLREWLFDKHTVICTSATLAVNKSFEFFRYQVGMPEKSKELIVDSPFNFKENSLIYISNGSDEKFHEIEQLLSYSKGRAFILFTSYKDMEYFYDIVNTPYPKLIQSSGVSRITLLETFKNTANAVLFATRSFWEGVDIKGDGLLQVIIPKLPFEIPSDIVYSSKIAKIDEKLGKGKHWTKYTIPDMCLKLKQGVGRLIRSTTDVGAISILDARINYQNYGKAVINTLPSAYRTQKLDIVEKFYKRWNR